MTRMNGTWNNEISGTVWWNSVEIKVEMVWSRTEDRIGVCWTSKDLGDRAEMYGCCQSQHEDGLGKKEERDWL